MEARRNTLVPVGGIEPWRVGPHIFDGKLICLRKVIQPARGVNGRPRVRGTSLPMLKFLNAIKIAGVTHPCRFTKGKAALRPRECGDVRSAEQKEDNEGQHA